jgi:ATP-binding cassette subfamily B protein
MRIQQAVKYIHFIRTLFEGSWIAVGLLGCLQIFGGVLPISIAWVNARLIDHIVYATKHTGTAVIQGYDNILIYIGLSCFFIITLELSAVVHALFADYFQDLIYQRIQFNLLKKIALYPTHYLFEDPQTNALITLAKEGARSISEYVNIGSYVMMGLVGVVPAFFLAYSITWWVPIVIIVTMMPLVYARAKVERSSWEIRKAYAPAFNQLHITEKVLTTPEFSKDIRLYRLQQTNLKYWSGVYHDFFKAVNSVRRRGSAIIAFWALVSAIGVAIPFWHIAQGTLKGVFTLGQLSFLWGVVTQLRSGISGLIYNWVDIIRAFLPTQSIVKLLSLPEHSASQQPDFKLNFQKKVSSDKNSDYPLLSFQDVYFCYPQQEYSVINGLTFELKKGESLAIVGENGAGKSTLIKLISRLYLPTSGNIFWKGHNIYSLPLESYLSNIAAVFQDFAQFPFSVRDNIDVRKTNMSKEQLLALLAQVNLSETLHDKLGSVLWKGFEGGIELSAGQWQRLAIARLLAQVEQSDLLLFDEPTSALDAHAEYAIMDVIRSAMQQKTAIVISHRLALTRFVDTIMLIKNGQILELGNHDALMNLKGEYYAMFQKQASYYTV